MIATFEATSGTERQRQRQGTHKGQQQTATRSVDGRQVAMRQQPLSQWIDDQRKIAVLVRLHVHMRPNLSRQQHRIDVTKEVDGVHEQSVDEPSIAEYQ